jgi:Tfp pilus assembly protein PilF
LKRVNVRFLLVLLAIVIGGGIGVVLLNRYQVSRNAGSLVTMARQKLEEGKLYEALGLYTRYLGMRPGDGEVLAEYAELMLERALQPDAVQADLSRAYNTLEEALRKNPDNASLRRKLAEFQIRIGRPVDAREHLQRLRQQTAETPEKQTPGTTTLGTADEPGTSDTTPLDPVELDLLLARSFYNAGDVDEALQLAGSLVGYDVERRAFDPQLQPAESTDAYILLAQILLDRFQDREAANDVLQQLVKRRGADANAWLALWRWHRQDGDLDAAAEAVAKAQAIAPDSLNVVFASFEMALARQDLDAAEAIAERARELFPTDERIYRGLASIALQRNDLAKAERVLQDGVGMMPGKASLLLMLADTLLQQRKVDETTEILGRITELYGATSPAVGLLEARVLMERQRWPQARQKLQQIRPLAVGLGELSRQIDLCLAQCYERLDEHDEQLDINRRLLIDDPSSLAARVGAAAALAASGRADEALREYEAVAAAIPAERLAATPQVWYPLLQLRLRDQMTRDAAERDWSQVDAILDQLASSEAITREQLDLLRADVLSRKDEDPLAVNLLRKAVEQPGASPQVWAALATLLQRTEGEAAVRKLLDDAPDAVANAPGLLLVDAQLAAARPREEAAPLLADIEKRARTLPKDDAAQALTMLASFWLGQGDRDAGERLLRDAAEMRPDDLRVRSALLDIAMATGDVAKASAAADAVAAAAGEDNARALVARAGVKILEVRQAQAAKESDGGKIELSADERRLLDDARGLLIQAENDRPGWNAIQRYQAEIDGLRGDLPAAIDRLQRAVRMGPATPDLVRQLVALLYATNRVDEARQALASLDTSDLAGFERLSAEMELRSGKLEEAVALAERSVSADSENVGELLWLGQLLERSNKTERAGEIFAKAVKVDPTRADAWLSLFAHQLTTGRRRAAENTLDRAVEQVAEPQRQLVLAQGNEMLGRIDDAFAAFQEAERLAPDDLNVGRAAAEFLIRNGRLGPARDTLRRLVDTSAASTKAADAATREWARRRLAGLIAERGTYRNLEEAIALIRQNADADGKLPPEDAKLEVSLLVNRPEPESWRRAIDTLETLQESQPLTTAERLTRAGLLERLGRWDEGRNELMSIVSGPNTPPSFIGMLVEKLIDHGDYRNAEAWLRRLQDRAATSPMTLALEARLAVATNNRPAAVAAARKLMPAGDLAADQAAQQTAIAKLFEDLEFTKAADQLFEKLAALSTDGKLARAEFLGRQGRTAEAFAVLDATWDSASLERLLTAALAAARTADDVDAATAQVEQWLAKAARLDPGSVTIPLLEAELRNIQGRPREAESLYRKLLARRDLPPAQQAIIANNLAFQLATPATATEAKQLIETAISALGPHPDLLDTRAMIHLATGDHDLAVADLRQAILQPSDVKYLHLAYAELKAGNMPEARAQLEAGRRKGLRTKRLSAADRARLGELETALGLVPEQARL